MVNNGGVLHNSQIGAPSLYSSMCIMCMTQLLNSPPKVLIERNFHPEADESWMS